MDSLPSSSTPQLPNSYTQPELVIPLQQNSQHSHEQKVSSVPLDESGLNDTQPIDNPLSLTSHLPDTNEQQGDLLTSMLPLEASQSMDMSHDDSTELSPDNATELSHDNPAEFSPDNSAEFSPGTSTDSTSQEELLRLVLSAARRNPLERRRTMLVYAALKSRRRFR